MGLDLISQIDDRLYRSPIGAKRQTFPGKEGINYNESDIVGREK